MIDLDPDPPASARYWRNNAILGLKEQISCILLTGGPVDEDQLEILNQIRLELNKHIQREKQIILRYLRRCAALYY